MADDAAEALARAKMAEALALAKKRRSLAKSNFTRSFNALEVLIAGSETLLVVTPQFEKVKSCWEKLEAAQEEFIDRTNIDVDEDPEGVKYLDGPGDAYLRAMKAYSEYYMRVEKDNDLNDQLKEDADKQAENDRIEKENRERKEAEDKRKAEELRAVFETAKAEFTSMVVTFKSMSLATKDSVDGAADSDKRSALSKLENEFQTVKSKLVHLSGIDPSEDIEAQKDSFAADVEIPFLAVQKDLLSQLKTSGGASQPVTSNNTNTNNTTRKESVKLPDFEGDENKNPYLEFPTWKKRWDTLISEYDSKFHMGLLLEHVDESAKTHIVGLETDYNSSIAKLDKVYGDPRKVISCVVTEVMSQPSINEGDYSSLIRYSNTLTNNYTSLKNLNLTNEMSNNLAMA